MKRTSTALRRLGVPVLAATTLLTAGQFALSTSAFAAGTLTISPTTGTTGQTTTVTATDTGGTAGDVVNWSFSTTNTSGGAASAFFTTGSGANTRATSCTLDATKSCSVGVTDANVETVPLTATNPTSGNSQTVNFVFTSANGYYTFTPNPAYGTSSPHQAAPGSNPNANAGAATQSVTYNAGTQSTNAASPQTIALTVSGNAYFLPQGSQPAQSGANSFTVSPSNNKQATCVTGTSAAAQTCTYSVADPSPEAVTVTATPVSTGTSDTTTTTGSGKINFNGLQFTDCSGNWQNTPGPNATGYSGNCSTQQANGTTVTYTVTYDEAGAPAAGRNVYFYLTNGTNDSFPSNQPSGSSLNVFSAYVACTTDSSGHCSVNVTTTGNASSAAGPYDILTAQTTNTAPYPTAYAQQTINFIANGTPGRLVQTSSERLAPSTQQDNVNIPGDVVQNTYTVYNCQANSTTGTNACAAGQALAGQTFTVSVSHGFFTNPCTTTINGTATTPSYGQCNFGSTAPTQGAQAGNLNNLGTTETVTTDSNGTFTVALGIARDQAFDQNGNLTAVVSIASGGSTITESNGTGNSSSSISCSSAGQSTLASGTPGSGNNGAPQAGCATGTPWTTDARPLNGASVKIVSIPASSSEAPLSDSSTNNVPESTQNPSNPSQGISSVRTFVVQATDQFGNLTSDRNRTNNTTTITLQKTGAGDLYRCGAYTGSNPCNGSNNAATQAAPGGNATNSSGSTTTTYINVLGSYLAPFTSSGAPAQDRFQATAQTYNVAGTTTPQSGTQTDTATWTAPTTTFNTYTASTSNSPAVATFTPGTKTLTDAVTINFYNPSNVVATFSTTPSNTPAPGTVVTVSATVKDQNGNPVQGDQVQFIRSGPNPNGTDCTATSTPGPNQPGALTTNSSGQAGFSFTCNTAGTQQVTIIVSDPSGNELARGTQTVTFTQGGSPGGNGGTFKTMPGYRSGSTDVLGNLNGGVVSSVKFGNSGDRAVFGDWNGDGTVTAGVFRPSTGMWYLTNDNHSVAITVRFGQSGDKPVVGDWNGDGTTGIGVYRPSTQTFFLANGFSGAISAKLKFGNRGDVPVVGDWDKAGQTKVGVYRPSNGTFYRIDHSGLKFGNAGDHPVAGDWNGDGITTIGVIRGSHWYLTDDNKTVSYSFNFGTSSTDFTYSNGASSAATVDNG